MTKYINKNIPSDYSLTDASDTAKKILKKDEKRQKEQEYRVAKKTDKEKAESLELENDFDLARDNIIEILEVTKEAVHACKDMALSSDSPRAIEVLTSLLKNATKINKELIDIHTQREEIYKAKKENKDSSQSTSSINNNSNPQLPNTTTNHIQQNNIIASPSELVKMLKQSLDADTLKTISTDSDIKDT